MPDALALSAHQRNISSAYVLDLQVVQTRSDVIAGLGVCEVNNADVEALAITRRKRHSRRAAASSHQAVAGHAG